MAEPIKRTGIESVEEAAYGAVKGGARGFLATFVAGAAVTAVSLTLAVAAVAAIAPGITVIGALAATAPLIGGLSLVGGGATTVIGGGIMTAIGAAFGLMKGADKAAQENIAYNTKSQEKLMSREADKVNAFNQGAAMAQQSMMPQVEQIAKAAHEQGRAEVMAELKDHASHAHAHSAVTHTAAPHDHKVNAHATHSHPADEALAKGKSWTKAEDARTAAAAAAVTTGPSVG